MYGVNLNKENIKSVLEDFYTLTKIRIGFYSYDQKEYLACSQKISNFCERIRHNRVVDQKCRDCDVHAFAQAKKTNQPFIYKCHAGLYEAVSPIMLEGKLLGFLMIGQVLPQKPDNEMWHRILEKFDFLNTDLQNAKEAFFSLVQMEREGLDAAVRMMDRSAKYIYFSGAVTIRFASMIQKVNDYIEKNIDRSILVCDLCKDLGVSMSHMNQVIQNEYGISTGKYILKIKMKAACEKLEESNLAIKDIAALTGFFDQNYFCRIFKKTVNMTPGQYRKLSREGKAT